tara:strand:- start:2312 stop:2767 length:456 start_codon:yes stop_codon:yes gene_type:complete
MSRILFALILTLSFSATASAQDDTPCGPSGQLPADLSNNVASDSMCFEIRMYTAEPEKDGEGGIDNLHRRFRNGEVRLFEKHGAKFIGAWQRMDNPNTLVWMMAYKNRAHRDEVFGNFLADPEWKELLAQYPVPIDIEAFFLSASDYSVMK